MPDGHATPHSAASIHTTCPTCGADTIYDDGAHHAILNSATEERDEKGRTPAEAKFIQETYGVDGYPVRIDVDATRNREAKMTDITRADGRRNAELEGMIAGLLSTIEFRPSGEHPETMLPMARQIIEIVQEYRAWERVPLSVPNDEIETEPE